MPGLYSKIKTVVDGETITAADRNAEHDNHITNAIPTMIDDYSANATEMQTVTDPYPSGSPSLATYLAGELERLRYLIKQITGEAQWYVDPDTDMVSLKSGTVVANLNAEQHNSRKVKVIDIGDWNMDTTASVSIAHGLTLGNIRGIQATIRTDAGSQHINLASISSDGNTPLVLADSTNVILQRLANSLFDSIVYDSTGYNRGWITVWYV